MMQTNKKSHLAFLILEASSSWELTRFFLLKLWDSFFMIMLTIFPLDIQPVFSVDNLNFFPQIFQYIMASTSVHYGKYFSISLYVLQNIDYGWFSFYFCLIKLGQFQMSKNAVRQFSDKCFLQPVAKLWKRLFL